MSSPDVAVDAGTAPATIEAVPDVAAAVFGARLPLARRYADVLADAGVVRGLLGPREPARLWTRHLLNCAVVTEVLSEGSRVVDVGSGAGLPGIVLAIRRSDLRIDLVEPLQRRAAFLEEVVAELGLDAAVRVVRGRAEEPATLSAVGGADVVTARAVAPLGRLAGWCAPLAAPGGTLALMKGTSAAAEVARDVGSLVGVGAVDAHLVTCGADILDDPVQVVIARVQSRGRTRGRRR